MHRRYEIDRKKDSGRETMNYICLFHFISDGLHILMCSFSTGSIHLVYFICNFRKSKPKLTLFLH